MHPQADALLNAHTDFLLNNFSEEQWPVTLQTELGLLLTALGTQRIDMLTNAEHVLELLTREILHRPWPEGLRQETRTLLRSLLNSSSLQNTRLGDLVNDSEASRIQNSLLDLEQLRQDVVHAVLASPVYSDVLSDLLYHSIKDYLLQENALAKKVPGMSSLMKLGKGVVDRIGSIEETFERTIKQYIRKNIRASVELSEELVEKAFKGPHLREALEQAWGQMKTAQVGSVSRYVGEREIDDAEDIVYTLFNHVRQMPLAEAVLKELVTDWFQRQGQSTLNDLLAELNLDLSRLAQSLQQTTAPALALLRQSGYLRERIRAHLLPFYESHAVMAILEQA